MNTMQLANEMGKLEKGLREFALKLTRDLVDAADLYQETAYRAVKNAHQFQENSNLRGWLMTIMRNIFINNYRRKRVRQTYQDWSENGYLIDSANNGMPNEGVVKVDYDELICIVDRLEEYLKIPFLLNYQGYKYEEIANELNAPLGTIKSRIHVARKRLKNMVKKHYQIPELQAV